MKTPTTALGVFTLLLLTMALTAFSTNAMAQSTIDTLQVQGYMQQSNGTAVTNSPTTSGTCVGGGYKLAFGVKQGSTWIWGTEACTAVTNGLFSANLTGVGSSLSGLSLPAGDTGMAADFSTVTLNAALLAAGSGELFVGVYAVDAISALHPFWTIGITAVPTAMLASQALGVTPGSVTFAGLATTAYGLTASTAIGVLPQTNATTGVLDISFIPQIPLNTVGTVSGALGAANGGTGDTTLAANGVLYGNGTAAIGATAAGTTGTVLLGNTSAAPSFGAVNLSTMVTNTLALANGGTGGTSASTARTSLGTAASGANGDITSLTGLTTALPITEGGTGAITATAALTALGADPAAGSTNVTTLGTITTGTWNSTAVGSTYGGTGISTAASTGVPTIAAGTWSVNATLPPASGGTGLATYTAAGAIPYSTAATTLAALPIGTAGQVLTVNAGATAPSWSAAPTSAPARSNIYLWEDFFTVNTALAVTALATQQMGTAFLVSSATTAGSVAIPAYTASHVGVVQINTGTATGKYVGVTLCGGGAAGLLSPNIAFETTDTMTFQASVEPLTAFSATGDTMWIGLLSATPAAATTLTNTLGAGFEILASTANGSTASWTKGATSAVVGSTPPTAVLSTFANYEITFSGGTLTEFVNGTSVNSTAVAASIPTATYLCPTVFRFKAGTTAAGAGIDYIGYTGTTSNVTGKR
jgi:hypothetical protein